jgi:VanZ family protein
MDRLIEILRSFDTRHYLIVAAVWTVGIITALTIPTPGLPKIDPSLTLDKIAHVVLFAGLAIFWMRALRPAERGSEAQHWTVPWRQTLIVMSGGTVFAIGSEFYQMLLPFKRTADPYDAIADVVGLILGLCAYLLYRYNTFASKQASGS